MLVLVGPNILAVLVIQVCVKPGMFLQKQQQINKKCDCLLWNILFSAMTE